MLEIDGVEFPSLDSIPSLNQIEDLAQHNQKLVQFDCQVTDMYDDEYFDCVMNAPPLLSANKDEHRKPLVYKYFSDLP